MDSGWSHGGNWASSRRSGGSSYTPLTSHKSKKQRKKERKAEAKRERDARMDRIQESKSGVIVDLHTDRFLPIHDPDVVRQEDLEAYDTPLYRNQNVGFDDIEDTPEYYCTDCFQDIPEEEVGVCCPFCGGLVVREDDPNWILGDN
jgi:hypothetical protein